MSEKPPLWRTTTVEPTWWAETRKKGRTAGAVVIVGMTGLALLTHTYPLIWMSGLLGTGVAAYAGRAAVRGRAARLPCVTDYTQLDAMPDRTLVRLRGRVRMTSPLPDASGSVLRRLDIMVRVTRSLRPAREKRFVHHAGQDFLLVDGNGREVLVRVAAAEVLLRRAPPFRRFSFDQLRYVETLSLPVEVPRGWKRVIAQVDELVVVDGQELEIVGTKTREADADTGALPRETPWRTVIAGGEVPVVIML